MLMLMLNVNRPLIVRNWRNKITVKPALLDGHLLLLPVLTDIQLVFPFIWQPNNSIFYCTFTNGILCKSVSQPDFILGQGSKERGQT